MRRYIRHPSNIPIVYSLLDKQHSEVAANKAHQKLNDISIGGLCFDAHSPLQKGVPIHIAIKISSPVFEADGQVAWCRANDNHYTVGVVFNDASTKYGIRMVEQVCHIEDYRSKILEREGRRLSSEEAAKEWVGKYASNFEQSFPV